MTKRQLINQVARELGLPVSHVEQMLATTLTTIREAVERGETVKLARFGTFSKGRRASRPVVTQGYRYQTKASEYVKFRPHSACKFPEGGES